MTILARFFELGGIFAVIFSTAVLIEKWIRK